VGKKKHIPKGSFVGGGKRGTVCTMKWSSGIIPNVEFPGEGEGRIKEKVQTPSTRGKCSREVRYRVGTSRLDEAPVVSGRE